MDWKPGPRRRALTAEEAELWAYTLRDAQALRRRGRRKADARPENGHAEAGHEANGTASAPLPALPNGAEKRQASSSPAPRIPDAPSRSPSPSKPPPLAAYDEKERRRLSKHPELIDARLDLHGFRQREAYSALRTFLFAAASRGHRHVLIITGKGTAAERQRDFFTEERGVLRRLVPQWLSEPDLRLLVVSYTVSHIRHGGEGALYVRLRRLNGG